MFFSKYGVWNAEYRIRNADLDPCLRRDDNLFLSFQHSLAVIPAEAGIQVSPFPCCHSVGGRNPGLSQRKLESRLIPAKAGIQARILYSVFCISEEGTNLDSSFRWNDSRGGRRPTIHPLVTPPQLFALYLLSRYNERHR